MPRPLLVRLAAAVLIGGAALADGARAQDADVLLNTWRAQQAARFADADALRFDLDLARRVDGPMGRHRLRAEAAVRMALDARPDAPGFDDAPRALDLDVRALEVNGVTVEPARFERETGPLRRLLGPHAAWLERPLTLPYPLLRTASAGALAAETYDGQPAWRLALDRLPPEVEAATLWFARPGAGLPASPRLLHSEVRLRLDGPPPDARRRPRRAPEIRARLGVVTDYARVGGLDVPAAQTLDLVAQQRRRIRTFTVLVEQQLRLSNVEVVP